MYQLHLQDLVHVVPAVRFVCVRRSVAFTFLARVGDPGGGGRGWDMKTHSGAPPRSLPLHSLPTATDKLQKNMPQSLPCWGKTSDPFDFMNLEREDHGS